MSPVAHEHGRLGEELACSFLVRKGYAIAERNYRIAGGEIEIIAQKDGILVFVEVKTRLSDRFGYPEEAVDWRKSRKMARAIRHYCAGLSSEPSFRIDIVSVTLDLDSRRANVRHIRDIEFSVEV